MFLTAREKRLGSVPKSLTRLTTDVLKRRLCVLLGLVDGDTSWWGDTVPCGEVRSFAFSRGGSFTLSTSFFLLLPPNNTVPVELEREWRTSPKDGMRKCVPRLAFEDKDMEPFRNACNLRGDFRGDLPTV